MEPSEFIQSVFDSFDAARRRGVMVETVDDRPIEGAKLWIDGQQTLSFVSCSYLGLEHDPRMKEGVKHAVDRWGTQFSTSRAWLSAPPYGAAEELLSTLFGGPALIVPSTTLGHAAVVSALIEERDAMILDHQVHASIHLASAHARANGASVEVVRHGDAQKLDERVAALCASKRHVYYAIDGVFSMFGDLPDVEHLHALMRRFDNLWLYVDDAHGMSIEGVHGRGVHLTRFGHHPRLLFGTSLNKAFASSGGCFVFPSVELRERVRLCGAPLVFSGPVQPPMLGAIVTSAAIHLSPEIETLQAELRARIARFNALCVDKHLPLLVQNDTAIFFLTMGPPRMAYRMSRLLRDEEGIYLGLAVYPIVAMKRAGLRIAITRNHTDPDLVRLADAVARKWPKALELENLTAEAVAESFRDALPSTEARSRAALARAFGFDSPTEANPSPRPSTLEPTSLRLEHVRSIGDLDTAQWNALLGARANFDAENLAMNERTFRGPRPENAWNPHYFIVRDGERPVLATFFNVLLAKDDFLLREEVSARIEARRKADPYFLTSRVVMMGSLVSEGNHLWMDRSGPWREALACVLDAVSRIQREAGATAVILRDLPTGDSELDAFLGEAGFAKTPMLPRYELRVDGWKDDAAFLARMSKRTRASFRKEVIEREPHFLVAVLGQGGAPMTPEARDRMFSLYQQTKARKLRLNTFDLPRSLFDAIATTAGWEAITLHLPAERGAHEDPMVAFAATYKHGALYYALLCGLDYGCTGHRLYRQLLWQLVRRTRAAGATRLGLGMDADFEKSRLGAEATPQSAWVQVTDLFHGTLLRQMVEETAFEPASR